jgi:CubicO group peptidase (beta-lactamase class C family)
MLRLLTLACAVACAIGAAGAAGSSAWDEVKAVLRGTDGLHLGDGWALVAGVASSPQPLLAYAGSNSTGLEAGIPVASAAKWVSGIVILRLVQEGIMHLDDQVQQYLPSWGVNSTDGRSGITLRQLLTFTSGIAGAVPACDAWLATGQRAAPDSLAPLADCVARIAASTPRLVSDPSGSVFAYEGFNLEVAAAMAEVAANSTWATLFAQTVQAQLGQPARYMVPQGGNFGPVEGGLVISPIDYGRFMALALTPHPTLLNASTLRAMWDANTTAGLPCKGSFTQLGCSRGWRYGMAMWLEEGARYGSSLGASGVYPRADLSNGTYAVLVPSGPMMREPPGAIMSRSVALMLQIWPLVMQALDEAHQQVQIVQPAQADAQACGGAKQVAITAQRAELRRLVDAGCVQRVDVECTLHTSYAEFVRSKSSVGQRTVHIHAFCDSLLASVPPPLLRSVAAPQWLADPLRQVGVGPHLWVKLKQAPIVAASALGCNASIADAPPVTAAQLNAALQAANGCSTITLVFADDIASGRPPEWLGLAVGSMQLPNGMVSVQSPSATTPLHGLPPQQAGVLYVKLLSCTQPQ